MFFTKPVFWIATTSLFITLANAAAFADELGPGATRFQPPGHTFAVSMPSAPVHSRRSTSTIIGKVWTDVWGSKHDGGDYSIAITDLPSVALWFNSAEDLIEKARDKMLQTLGARRSGLRAFHKGDFTQQLDYFIPGRIGSPARKGRAWFALIDDKLVVITALVPLGTDSALDRHFSAIVPDVSTIARR